MIPALIWNEVGYDQFEPADLGTTHIMESLGYIQPLRKSDVDAIQGLVDAGYLAEAIESRKARGR